MRVTLRELFRRPGRFLPVGGAMTLLVVLLVSLGAFLDGLALDQTGAFRSQGDRLWVLSAGAELQLTRSLVDATTATAVADLRGVAEVGGLTAFESTVSVVGDGATGGDAPEPLDVVVFGYELGGATLPPPPAEGDVVVDDRLREFVDASVGDGLAVGPTGARLEIAGFVTDATQGAPTLWVGPSGWRRLAAEAAPTRTPPEDAVHALVVTVADGADAVAVAAAIDAATGSTQTVDLDTLLDGQPVVAQQSATFQGIIVIAFVVVLLVVALFFALLILERVRLYAVLKALGARSSDLVGGVVAQAVVLSVGAFLVGGAIAIAFVSALPADLPVRLVAGRILIIFAGTVATSIGGVVVVLRRILRIEPAQAIG